MGNRRLRPIRRDAGLIPSPPPCFRYFRASMFHVPGLRAIGREPCSLCGGQTWVMEGPFVGAHGEVARCCLTCLHAGWLIFHAVPLNAVDDEALLAKMRVAYPGWQEEPLLFEWLKRVEEITSGTPPLRCGRRFAWPLCCGDGMTLTHIAAGQHHFECDHCGEGIAMSLVQDDPSAPRT